MFHSLISSPRKVWIAALASLACLCGPANAQNFTMQVANPNPLGLGNFVPGFAGGPPLDMSMEGAIKGAFNFGIGATAEYNSNIYATEDNEQSDVNLRISPAFSYTSDPEGGAEVVVTAGYAPQINDYVDSGVLNGIDHSGSATLTFNRGRTQVALFGSVAQYTGTDRLSGGVVAGGTTTSGGIRATREIAPRTSLFANATASMSDYGSGTYTGSGAGSLLTESEGADEYTAELGGSWQASERTSFGPSVRFTTTKSDNTGTRDAWTLLFNGSYKASERIFISAAVGPELSQNSGDQSGGTTFHVNGNVTATYLINERWSWMNSINSATVPSPDETGYNVFNVSFTTGLSRQLTQGTLSGGIDFNVDQYESIGNVTVDRDDEQNVGVFLRYGRPLFSDRIGFSSAVNYSVNDGEEDWSQFTISAGLSVAF